MKLKDFAFDVWLGLGLVGMAVGLAVGLASPLVGIFYLLWGLLK